MKKIQKRIFDWGYRRELGLDVLVYDAGSKAQQLSPA